MPITLSRRTVVCQSVAEVYLIGVSPLGAVSHLFNLILIIIVTNGLSSLFNLASTLDKKLQMKYRLCLKIF